ncbi:MULTISPECIES: choice-of-anchor C family protein [unclassified Sphingomonas]|uniref:choice-of-anchor C family PEP-CTERM protein n=1 Tax=unclassified Sphingomonas TaxID=196159 RepID=UPI001AD2D96D|nr:MULTISPECIES: choice-of-anchor C family protein [unclassified Sphingomonas]MBN8849414.1 choice-of-anchor C family protein [Sphingomonas sp.]
MRKILVLTTAAVALALPAGANAAAFVNGSFEDGVAPGVYTTVAGGDSSSIAGWTVTGNSVDYVGSYWPAQDGSRSIDLNGNAQGGIEQTFDTVAGTLYSVTFWLAGNTDGAPVTKSVLVGASGNDGKLVTFDSSAFDRGDMGWAKYSYNFVAQNASTTLSFASQDAGPFGAALDNVSLLIGGGVPEPATWGLMILGFGGIAGAMRRRKATGMSFA